MERRVRVRFAPSPTGPLHIGGVRTALYNYLFAKKHGGDFLLRIEDTDQTRFVPGAENYIIEALKWLSIPADEGVGFAQGKHAPYRQSERKAMYKQYADQLVANDYAYYAFDTAEELDTMRDTLKANGMSPMYDAVSRMSMKNSLTLPSDEVEKRLASGEPYVIRIKLPRKEEVRFHDIIRGWVVVHTNTMDDKVLFKSDGMPTYHLANVVDDYLMEITHVIRGEEWLPSAPLHVMLYRYLGWEDKMPEFAHLPLLLKPEGNGKLSKRDGDRLGFPVFPLNWTDPKTGEQSSGYRESGYFPEAVINILAFLGWHPSDHRELFNLEELVNEFSLERVSKSGAKFDVQKAHWFNQQYLRGKSDAELAVTLKAILDQKGITANLDYITGVCGLMKEKVSFSNELFSEGAYFFIEPGKADEALIAKKFKEDTASKLKAFAAKLSEVNDWTGAKLEESFHQFCEAEGKKPGEVMLPFRLSISGVAGGPPIFDMAALLGKETVLNRMEQFLASLPTSLQA
ncbi:MAG: glutamate--tRNA ligase [Bacteroidetes bacterium]|nr:MAG: glutamate--tRNA ligase [Bacteroidota bacterium]